MRQDIRFKKHLYNRILLFGIDNAQPFQVRETVFREQRSEYIHIAIKPIILHSYIENQLFKIRQIGTQDIFHHRIGQAATDNFK